MYIYIYIYYIYIYIYIYTYDVIITWDIFDQHQLKPSSQAPENHVVHVAPRMEDGRDKWARDLRENVRSTTVEHCIITYLS